MPRGRPKVLVPTTERQQPSLSPTRMEMRAAPRVTCGEGQWKVMQGKV